ncbi:MAG: serine/threonine protein kinase [Pseudomonadales bacterium]|nr:serine/threonine protein kinase [Pseudomonadales bacterium]
MKLSRYFKKKSGNLHSLTTEQNEGSNLETEATTSTKNSIEETILPTLLELNNVQYTLKPFKKGGICDIYKGLPNTKDLPTIAVKMIRKEWYTNSRVRRQFSTESQIVRDLRQEHLPRYISRGLLSGKPYFAYEYIEGFRLINLSQKRDIFPPELVKDIALDIICQLLRSLHYMHTKLNPIAHGDISSENIIFDDWHNIHLIDFGCAHYLKLADNNAYQWVGKPSFISPEQAKGEPWDHRSDIYQAGILYYELATGARWNTGTNPRNKTLFAASAEPPRPDFLAKEAGINISTSIAKMLHPQPQLRYQSANNALKDLEK